MRTNREESSLIGGDPQSESLLFQKTYFESIVENFPDGVVIFDRDGTVTRVNAAFVDIFGYSSSEAIGRDIAELLAPPEKLEEALRIRREISRGKHVTRKTVRRHNDGTDIHVSLDSAAVTVNGSVSGYFVIYRDITVEKLAEARLLEMATTDSLTGLYNRRHFFDLSEREFARSRRSGSPLVLLMIDIDHFKNVNDSFGHDAGDRVLKDLADLGNASFRSMDIFGRIGGEEFAVLLPETILANGVVVAERFKSMVERMQVDMGDGTHLQVTVSVGIGTAASGEPGLDRVLAAADRALYSAKKGGRNRVAVNRSSDPQMPQMNTESGGIDESEKMKMVSDSRSADTP